MEDVTNPVSIPSLLLHVGYTFLLHVGYTFLLHVGYTF